MNRFFFGPLPFDDVSGYIEAATTLASWIREAGSTPVIYGIWAMKAEEEVQSIVSGYGQHADGEYGDVCGWVPGEAGCGYVLWGVWEVGVTLKKF